MITTPCTAEPDMWFATCGDRLRQAQEACSHCPMLRHCAKAALDQRPTDGIWAGVNLSSTDPATARRQLRSISRGTSITETVTVLQRKADIDAAAAAKMRDNGATRQEIADTLGYSISSISKMLYTGIDLSTIHIPSSAYTTTEWTDERVDIATKMFELGASYPVVARQLRVGVQKVRNRFPGRTRPSRRVQDWPETKKQQVRDMLAAGTSEQQVSLQLGISPRTVAKYFRAAS